MVRFFSAIAASSNKGNNMEINFECKKCGSIFNADVGEITMNEKTFRPEFEKPLTCPKCGVRTVDEVLLTELGQSQMTQATIDV